MIRTAVSRKTFGQHLDVKQNVAASEEMQLHISPASADADLKVIMTAGCGKGSVRTRNCQNPKIHRQKQLFQYDPPDEKTTKSRSNRRILQSDCFTGEEGTKVEHLATGFRDFIFELLSEGG